VFLAHFAVMKKPIDVQRIYNVSALPAINSAGVVAWLLGFIVYRMSSSMGATLPALATSMITYILLSQITSSANRPAGGGTRDAAASKT
jgi:hypothetical protein